MLVASEDAVLADEIIRHLEEFPHWSAAVASSLTQLQGALEAEPPDVVLISADLTRQLAADGAAPHPGVRFVLVGRELPIDVLRAAVAVGAGDTILWPKEIKRLRRAVEQAPAAERPRVSHGTLVAVWGPKGGSGTSIVAAHLAAAVASLGPPPLLIDLDLDHADQTAILGVEEETKTVLDLIRVVDEITPAAIEGVARRHPSGLRAVLAPGSPGESGLVKPSEAAALLRALREASDLVIVDLPSGWGEMVPFVAEESNHFVVVVTPDLLSLRRSRDALRMLRAAGLPSDRIRILVNRWPGPAIGMKDVEASLGSTPVATVRYDPQIEKASDRGELANLGVRQLEGAARRITGRPDARGRHFRRRRR